ncbi:hypothetical protein [Actinoplanes sp. DH11]
MNAGVHHPHQACDQAPGKYTAYNQPPHPSFFIGDGMRTPPRPTIRQP